MALSSSKKFQASNERKVPLPQDLARQWSDFLKFVLNCEHCIIVIFEIYRVT